MKAWSTRMRRKLSEDDDDHDFEAEDEDEGEHKFQVEDDEPPLLTRGVQTLRTPPVHVHTLCPLCRVLLMLVFAIMIPVSI